MAYVPFAFTDAQLTDIRRFCGYPARGDGSVLFPAPWVNVQYLALEYRLQTLSQSEGAVVVTYLATLNTLEAAIPAAAASLEIGVAAAFTRNPKEMRERNDAYDSWRRRLCAFMGVDAGPDLIGGPSATMRMVV
jgi:hypothetical protein